MNRSKRKCFAGSLAVHGALLFFVIFGSAFFSSPKPMDDVLPMVMVPLTDGPTSTPNPSAEPPPPVRENRAVVAPEPAPQPPAPVKVTPKPVAKPVKPAPEEDEAPDPPTEKGTLPKPPEKKKTTNKRATEKPHSKPVPNLDRLVDKRIVKTEDDSGETRAREQRRRELAGAISAARSSITKEGSKSTDIGMIGNAGPAFANYNQMIYSVYKAKYDEEVLQAGEFATEETSVRVSITISHGGNVTDTQVHGHSGNRVLDELVRKVLHKVKFIAPFPPEAKDSERTFEIQFNLKPNGQIG